MEQKLQYIVDKIGELNIRINEKQPLLQRVPMSG